MILAFVSGSPLTKSMRGPDSVVQGEDGKEDDQKKASGCVCVCVC